LDTYIFPFYLLISAIFISFYSSFMGGANDFANAFGTSIGSRAITLKQAVMIAIFAELIGAVLIGANVTNTIRKGIVDPSHFDAEPMILALGLLAALVGSGFFLTIATIFGLPVSTTHAIVGAVIGFGMVALGFEVIRWGNVGFIAMSWVISPIGGGIASYTVFRIIRKTIFEKENPIEAASKIVPIFVGITLSVISLAMLYKGLKNLHLDFPIHQALPIAILIGLTGVFIVRRRIPRSDERHRRIQLVIVESNFRYLQVMTAAYIAFAHGANDVANSIGPLAGIWSIFYEHSVALQCEVPVWILLLGGIGIVLGLAVFGRRVIETVGKKITSITFSRGFSAEFAAATVVLVFSKLGMPVSTTHTLVGAVIGVGLARGIGAIDLRVVRKILMSWVVTIPAAAVVTALTFILLRSVYGGN